MVLEGLYIELVTILWGNAGERLWVVIKTTECLKFFLSIFKIFFVAQTEQKEYSGWSILLHCLYCCLFQPPLPSKTFAYYFDVNICLGGKHFYV